jgi:PiT family inorganic phosphate transporter
LRAMGNDFVLGLVVITALAFDFTNGFHDTGNAMATSIATGALPPRIAVAISGVLNLVGAFLSFTVAGVIAKDLVNGSKSGIPLTAVFAGLAGGIIWNLATWYLGIPSSSSHALIGGILGASIAASGGHAVLWHNVAAKVVIPAVLSPVIAILIAAVGTYLVYALTRGVGKKAREHGFRLGQIGSASMVSLAHGTNDAQKTMGVITLALITNGTIGGSATAPDWVIISCALAISLGTYIGGWRVIRTLGKGLVEIESPQGMAAESSSAATILLASHFGYSLSTTHVATGSILGTGIGKKGAEVRWSVAGRMATAWVLTLPAAGIVGAVSYYIAHGIGGDAGVIVVFAMLVAAAGAFYAKSRKTKVDPGNVNAEWTGDISTENPTLAAVAA